MGLKCAPNFAPWRRKGSAKGGEYVLHGILINERNTELSSNTVEFSFVAPEVNLAIPSPCFPSMKMAVKV